MHLWPLQIDLKRNINGAWDDGAKNVLAVSPCGTGKTVVASDIIKEHDGPACAIAHRKELVGQISLALARDEIRHKIIGPKSVISFVNKIHMDELGKSYYQSNASVGVAGVDTLTRGATDHSRWLKSCTLWVQDECHHILYDNKWGKAAAMFPNAKKGLGFTATPERADYKGLGSHADGIMDIMVQGPSARDVINMGYLTDYRIFNPESNFDRSKIPISDATGDFTQAGNAKAVRDDPQIIGDIVKHYKLIAMGKLGITFVPSVDIAIKTASKFNLAGIPAAVIHGGTPDAERVSIIKKFKNREFLQLVNVDLFGEGFDLPAIEIVQMARPTKSYALYHQQFMRALRLMISPQLMSSWDTYTDSQRLKFIAESRKPHAIIIDHVNNIDTDRGGHGLPDKFRTFTLDRQSRKSRQQASDVIPTRTCIYCTDVYERIYKICPTCNEPYVPATRSDPQFVDGDLTELDPATLARMRGELERVNMSPEDYRAELASKYVPLIGQLAGVKRQRECIQTREALGMSIAWWAGYQRSLGRPDDESYRRFYFTFGIDVLTAQTLKTKDTLILADKINHKLGELAKCV